MSWKETNEYQRKTFKGDAIRIASALAKAKIDYSLEWVVPRYGEFKNGHPLSYVVDLMVLDERFKPLAIEMEGEGSSSKDNTKRDQYLNGLGITVLHIDNRTPSEKVVQAVLNFRRSFE